MTDDDSTTQQIVIGGNVFKAVKSINLTKEVAVCKRRVESQEEMADHAIQNPAVFEFEIELINSENDYDLLDVLHTNKTPFDLVTHRGQFSNMILSKLSDRKSGSQSNTTSATITVQQVLVGTVSTRAITTMNTDALPVDITPRAEENFPGSSTLKNTTPVSMPDTIVPVRTEEVTIVKHCDGLTARIDALRSTNRMVPTV